MPDKTQEIADWIKKEEGLGYRENELVNSLLQERYSNAEIQTALHEVHSDHFTLNNFVAEIGWPLILLFIISDIFFYYDKPGISFTGSPIFLCFLVAVTTTFILSKKTIIMRNHGHFSDLIILFFTLLYLYSFSVTLQNNSYIFLYWVHSGLIMIFALSLFSNKSENHFQKFLGFCMTVTISFAFAKLVFIVINLLLMSQAINLFTVELPFIISIFAFSWLLNFLSFKKRIFGRSLLTIFIVLSFLLIIGLSLLVYTFSYATAFGAHNSAISQDSNLLNSLEFYSVTEIKTALGNNLGDLDAIGSFPIILTNGKYEYYRSICLDTSSGEKCVNIDDIKEKRYDCDMQLNCKSSSEGLSKILHEDNYVGFVTEDNIIYIFSQEILRKHYPAYGNLLEGTPVAKELDERWNDVLLSVEKQMAEDKTKKIDFWYIYNFRQIEDTEKRNMKLIPISVNLQKLTQFESFLHDSYEEYNRMTNSDIDEYLKITRQNIELLKNKIDNFDYAQDDYGGAAATSFSILDPYFTFPLAKKYQAVYEKGYAKSVELRKLSLDDELFKEKDGETKYGRFLRLRAYEKLLTSNLIELCQNSNACRKDAFALADTYGIPELCSIGFHDELELMCMYNASNPYYINIEANDLSKSGKKMNIRDNILIERNRENAIIPLVVANPYANPNIITIRRDDPEFYAISGDRQIVIVGYVKLGYNAGADGISLLGIQDGYEKEYQLPEYAYVVFPLKIDARNSAELRNYSFSFYYYENKELIENKTLIITVK